MSMSYKVADYFILTDNADDMFHHTRSTERRKYKCYICVHSSVVHRETKQHHTHINYLLTDDISKITDDVMSMFLKRCEQRSEENNFDVEYHDMW